MRGKTLGECLTGLRTELRLSLNEASNVQVRDTHVAVLQRAQEELIEEYTWKHMNVFRFLRPQIGQRFYDPLGCKKRNQTTGVLEAAGDMSIDNIVKMWLRDGTEWRELGVGIDPLKLFNQWDSETGETAWPIAKWQIAEDDNVEFWPIPDQDGDEDTFENMVMLQGRRNILPFTDNSDVADVDDQALIQWAAAKLVRDPDEAAKKLAAARKRMTDVRANANPRRSFKLFSEPRSKRLLRGPPTVYVRVES